jgi:hypothetical protein
MISPGKESVDLNLDSFYSSYTPELLVYASHICTILEARGSVPSRPLAVGYYAGNRELLTASNNTQAHSAGELNAIQPDFEHSLDSTPRCLHQQRAR